MGVLYGDMPCARFNQAISASTERCHQSGFGIDYLVVMTDQGARVSLAEPLAVAGLWVLCLKNRKLSPTWRIVCVLFGGFVILKSEYRCAVIAEDEKNIYLSKMDNLRMHESSLWQIMRS